MHCVTRPAPLALWTAAITNHLTGARRSNTPVIERRVFLNPDLVTAICDVATVCAARVLVVTRRVRCWSTHGCWLAGYGTAHAHRSPCGCEASESGGQFDLNATARRRSSRLLHGNRVQLDNIHHVLRGGGDPLIRWRMFRSCPVDLPMWNSNHKQVGVKIDPCVYVYQMWMGEEGEYGEYGEQGEMINETKWHSNEHWKLHHADVDVSPSKGGALIDIQKWTSHDPFCPPTPVTGPTVHRWCAHTVRQSLNKGLTVRPQSGTAHRFHRSTTSTRPSVQQHAPCRTPCCRCRCRRTCTMATMWPTSRRRPMSRRPRSSRTGAARRPNRPSTISCARRWPAPWPRRWRASSSSRWTCWRSGSSCRWSRCTGAARRPAAAPSTRPCGRCVCSTQSLIAISDQSSADD